MQVCRRTKTRTETEAKERKSSEQALENKLDGENRTGRQAWGRGDETNDMGDPSPANNCLIRELKPNLRAVGTDLSL